MNAGKTSCVELRVGDQFKGEIVHREAAYVGRFVARVPGQETLVEVKALPGRPHPAGWIRPSASGVYALGYQSNPRYLELHPAKFREYLLEESLTEIAQERFKAGESDLPGREEFVRCAKCLMVTDDGASGESDTESSSSPFRDEALGLKLELIALDDPRLSTGQEKDGWRVQLLQDGKPVAGARVRCLAKADGKRLLKPQVGTTDEKGRVRFDLVPGRTWLVTTVRMERAEDDRRSTDPSALDRTVDWVSHWASLTFQS